jgi:hypothetical protein
MATVKSQPMPESKAFDDNILLDKSQNYGLTPEQVAKYRELWGDAADEKMRQYGENLYKTRQTVKGDAAASAGDLALNSNIKSAYDKMLAPSDLSGGHNNAINSLPGIGEMEKQQLLNEAQLQKGMSEQSAEELRAKGSEFNTGYDTTRKSALNDLATLLADAQKRQLMDRIPDIAEQANMRGIYRSTGTGNAVAREASRLTASTQEALAAQGLADRAAGIGDSQATNNYYLNSLGSAQGNYQQGRYGALQRQYSMNDLAAQAAVSRELGKDAAPVSVNQSGGGGLSGALLGGGAGYLLAPALGVTGGVGAAAGALASVLLGKSW